MDIENIDNIINILKNTNNTKIKKEKPLEDEEKLDTIVQSIIQKFKDRSKFGKLKYGTDLDRTDLEFVDWITHAQEELMDGILYLEKIKKLLTRN